jgi:hypothetical protein
MLMEETKSSIIIFNESENFLRVTTKPNTNIQLADAMHDFEVGVKMVNSVRMPVLADSRNSIEHSEEVRSYYASEDVAKHISAMAILIDSLPTRLIGNFFIKINKPYFPTKLFTAEVEAVKWLKK